AAQGRHRQDRCVRHAQLRGDRPRECGAGAGAPSRGEDQGTEVPGEPARISRPGPRSQPVRGPTPPPAADSSGNLAEPAISVSGAWSELNPVAARPPTGEGIRSPGCKIACFPRRTMAKASQREAVPAPAFIRLLARLADVELRTPDHALVDELAEWVDWTRAVALSGALDGRLPAGADAPAAGGDARQECARVRAGLVTAIHADPDTAAPKWGNTRPGSDGYAVYRERYLELQRTMQAETGRLRGQLRERLGRASAELARLAEVDAVMEATLSPRELTLLATVPILLGHHFERLRADGEAPQAN